MGTSDLIGKWPKCEVESINVSGDTVVVLLKMKYIDTGTGWTK